MQQVRKSHLHHLLDYYACVIMSLVLSFTCVVGQLHNCSTYPDIDFDIYQKTINPVMGILFGPILDFMS